jgi:hypothetical protein
LIYKKGITVEYHSMVKLSTSSTAWVDQDVEAQQAERYPQLHLMELSNKCPW